MQPGSLDAEAGIYAMAFDQTGRFVVPAPHTVAVRQLLSSTRMELVMRTRTTVQFLALLTMFAN